MTGGSDALGAVAITVDADGRKVTGRGVATDVVEASARAYLNAVNKLVRLRERGDVRDESIGIGAVMAVTESVNLWRNAEHALTYLREARRRSRTAPRRYEVLFELLPAQVERVLDLGTGDGNTLELVLAARPGATGVGLDFQDEMLDRARERFAGATGRRDPQHDLDEPLPADLGEFDVVVSSFAIHHLEPERQRALYGEVFDRLAPGWRVRERRARGVARTERRHEEFLDAIGEQPRAGRSVQQAGCRSRPIWPG